MNVGEVVKMFKSMIAGRAVWWLASVSQAIGWKPVQPNSVEKTKFRMPSFWNTHTKTREITTEEVTLGMYQAVRKNCLPRSLALSTTARISASQVWQNVTTAAYSTVLKTAVRNSGSFRTFT